jgi:hypothetical protein
MTFVQIAGRFRLIFRSRVPLPLIGRADEVIE